MELVCIVCPMGCTLNAEMVDGKPVVTGHTCERGHQYGVDELTCPLRMLTSSVAVQGGNYDLLSVKTSAAIPKAKIREVLLEVAKLHPQAPVAVGDVLLPKVAGTDADIVATRKVSAV